MDDTMLSRDEALAELREMFEANVSLAGDLDVEDIKSATGIKSRVGVHDYMKKFLDEGRYIKLTGVYDRRTGRVKTVWRRVVPAHKLAGKKKGK